MTFANGFLAGTSGTFNGVAITVDGLELYDGINGISTSANGTYCSTRAAVGSSFSVGQRISTIDSSYEGVSGSNPPQLQGWQHEVMRNCALLGTYSSGGCNNQDLWWLTRQ